MIRPITLTTDFGSDSHYVAQMKASILNINPDARIVDATHSIEPQNIAQAALLAAEVCPQFPTGSIHVIVVDPGVGTRRRIVLARIGGHDYIAPDNGLLSLLTQTHPVEAVYEIRETRYWRTEISATFHGRDIMAPVAAHLSLGVERRQMGPPTDSLEKLPWPAPTIEGRQITGQVVFVDHFGNLISSISAEWLRDPATSARGISVECQGDSARGMCRTYGDRTAGELVALIGSAGVLELAVVNGSAADQLGAAVGDAIRLTW